MNLDQRGHIVIWLYTSCTSKIRSEIIHVVVAYVVVIKIKQNYSLKSDLKLYCVAQSPPNQEFVGKIEK